MKPHRFILESYKESKSRHICPGCGYNLKFTRYIDQVTGEQVAEHVGRCDRENSCSYHYTPRQFYVDNPGKRRLPKQRNQAAPVLVSNPRPTDYLPFEGLEKSLGRYKYSNLYPFLVRLFREAVACWICENYFIGANKIGDTVFWQVDIGGHIRQAKFMRYDSATGRRNKEFGAFFAGKKILGVDANLKQCFFGEYLLSNPENIGKSIAIVESEKTAVIASIYFPQLVWLATGGMTGCKWTEKEVCSVLKGRKIILFPDLGAFDNWNEKAKVLVKATGSKVIVSDLLECNANETDRKSGLDIADYLLKKQDSSGLAMSDSGYPVIFDFKY